jgi:hypothetical protein
MRKPCNGSHEGPSRTELAAIEAEWPSIRSELERLDQEIARLSAGSLVSELDVRRVRRLARRSLRPAAVSVPVLLVRRGEAA